MLAIKLRDPKGISDTRLGRFILSTGAVRAVHVDGGHAILRAPSRTNFEIFGGVPVVGKGLARGIETIEATAVGSDPHRTRTVLVNRQDAVVGQAARILRIVPEVTEGAALAVEQVQPAVGRGDPKSTA